MVHLATPRQCSKCGEYKTWFYADKRRATGLQAQCRDCQLVASKNRYANKSPEEKAQVVARVKASRDSRRYNLPPGGRDKLLAAQFHRCALCGTDDPAARDWHVDHCHTTGAVRGILCKTCNQGLGCLGDNVAGLQKAIAYLKSGPHTVQHILNGN